MQVHFHLALTHIQRLLNFSIAHALDVAHNDNSSERLIERLNSLQQLSSETLLIDAPSLIFMACLLRNICIIIYLILCRFVLANMINHRIACHTHKPGTQLVVVDLLPVLPQLDEYFLGDVLSVFPGAQAIVGKGKYPLPILLYGLPVLR